jgi:hypothetical protein
MTRSYALCPTAFFTAVAWTGLAATATDACSRRLKKKGALLFVTDRLFLPLRKHGNNWKVSKI